MIANHAQLFLLLEVPDPTASEIARAELLLALSQGLVEGEAGQPLQQSEQTLTLPGSGTRALLVPRFPLVEVAEVIVDGATLTEGVDFRWRRAGIVERINGVWKTGDDVELTFTAGFDPIPADILGVILEVAQRSWAIAPGLSQETLGDHSQSFAAGGVQMQLTEAQREIARRYGLPGIA